MNLEQELQATFEKKLNRPLTEEELTFINWMSQKVSEQSDRQKC